MKKYKVSKRQKNTLLIAALTLVASQSAFADTFEKLEDNWYVGGGIGQSHLQPDGGAEWDVTDDSDLSKKAYVGYNIGRDFGLEAFWNDFGDATVTSKGNEKAKVSYLAYGANLVYHVPSYLGKIHPIIKLGIAKVETEGDGVRVNQQNEVDFMAGVGAEYDLGDGFRIRGEYERFDKDLEHVSIGINWRPTLTKRVVEQPKVQPVPAVAPRPIVIVNNQAPVVKQAPPKTIVKYVKTPAPKPVIKYIKTPAPKPVVKHVPVYVQTPAPKPVVRTIVKQAPAPVVQRIIVNNPAPKPQPKVIHKTLAGGSNFATNSAQLTVAGRNALNRLASDLLRDRVVIHNISIIGHTDSVGSNAANLRLSQQRATTVAGYLSSRGLNRNIMTVLGRGEAQPVANNATAAGRAQNRRVNLVVKGSQTINR